MRDEAAPDAGARYLLERREVNGATARYVARILTPRGEFVYEARLTAPGAEAGGGEATGGAGGTAGATTDAPADTQVSMQATGAAASPSEEQYLRLAATQLARGAPERVTQGLPTWPARIQRWRADKSG